MFLQYGELRSTSGWGRFTSLGHPSTFQRVSRLRSVTARHSSCVRHRNFAALSTGRHLYSGERPSGWTLAHILLCYLFARNILLSLRRRNIENRSAFDKVRDKYIVAPFSGHVVFMLLYVIFNSHFFGPTTLILCRSRNILQWAMLLWMRVVCVGAKPYSSHGANQVKGLLARGYRMDRPTDCPVELYISLSLFSHNYVKFCPSYNNKVTRKDNKIQHFGAVLWRLRGIRAVNMLLQIFFINMAFVRA